MQEQNISELFPNERVISAEDLIRKIQDGNSIAAALGLSKNDLEAIYATGYQFFNQGKYEKALQLFAFLLIREQSDRRFFIAAGTCFQMLKIYEKAIDYLGIASIWEPSDPAPAVQIAECLMSMGRSNEACDLLGRIENEFGHLPKYEKILIKVKSILKIKKDFDQKK